MGRLNWEDASSRQRYRESRHNENYGYKPRGVVKRATAKQISYLAFLTDSDKEAFVNLTCKEASDMIEEALREQNGYD